MNDYNFYVRRSIDRYVHLSSDHTRNNRLIFPSFKTFFFLNRLFSYCLTIETWMIHPSTEQNTARQLGRHGSTRSTINQSDTLERQNFNFPVKRRQKNVLIKHRAKSGKSHVSHSKWWNSHLPEETPEALGSTRWGKLGRSGLSTWKYQFSYDHWSQVTLSSVRWETVQMWPECCLKSAKFDLPSYTGCWLCVHAELVIGQCRLGCTEPVVWSTLRTTCGRCQAGLEIPIDLPMWSLVGQQDWKKKYIFPTPPLVRYIRYSYLKNVQKQCFQTQLTTKFHKYRLNMYDGPL